jgi:hypothetical protein
MGGMHSFFCEDIREEASCFQTVLKKLPPLKGSGTGVPSLGPQSQLQGQIQCAVAHAQPMQMQKDVAFFPIAAEEWIPHHSFQGKLP